MYVLLHGAIKNVGDFLIFERARNLIRTYRKTDDLVEIPRWQSLEPHLDVINRADAVILCGGPAYASDFYPGIYPFTNDIAQIKPPIVPLGLGWSGKSNGENGTFAFTEQSQEVIQAIHGRIQYSSVRDVLTEHILHDQGIENVLMTGCPAWYHLPSVEKPFNPPKQIRKIAISAPAQSHNFLRAAQMVQWAKRRFPDAEHHLVFHRGIWWDKNTPLKDAVLNPLLAAYGLAQGVRVIDAAYSTDHISFYQDCDLHVGFRVHAHIKFLSYRKPSILIHEDGRGAGQTATLLTKDVPADPANLPQQLDAIVEEHERTHYEQFEKTFAMMREKHGLMKDFVESF